MVNEYASVGGGGPSAGYSGAAESGSAPAGVAGGASIGGASQSGNDYASWISAEVAAREAAARANNPQGGDVGVSTSGSGPTMPLPEYAVQNRPGYTPVNQLGDSRTQALIQEGFSPSAALMQQIEQAKLTPGYSDDRYYQNELQKFQQNFIELASAEHARGMAAGIPTGPNQYEYGGDLAYESLKKQQGIQWDAARAGIPAPDISPVYPDLANLQRAVSEQQMGPYGQLASYSSGLGRNLSLEEQQQVAILAAGPAGWGVDLRAAGDVETNKEMGYQLGFGRVFREQEQPSAASKQITSADIIPSPVTTEKPAEEWYRGIPFVGGFIPEGVFRKTSEIDIPWARNIATQIAPVERTTTTFGAPVIVGADDYFSKRAGADFSRTFVSPETGKPTKTMVFEEGGKSVEYDLSKVVLTPQVTATTYGESPAQRRYAGIGEYVRSVTPENEVGETVVRAASIFNPVTGPPAALASVANVIDPGIGKIVSLAQLSAGQYTQFREDPLLSVGAFAVGVATGGVARLASAVYTPIKAAAGSGKVVAAMDTFATEVFPRTMAGLYAIDIGGRSTRWGKDLSVDAATRAKGLILQEAAPMAVGGYYGYFLPEVGAGAYSTARAIPGAVSERAFELRQNVAGIKRVEPGTLTGEKASFVEVYETPKKPSFDNEAGAFGTYQEATTDLPTIDLRSVIDFNKYFDIRPSNVATRAEQAMIIAQYGLTKEEIALAKRTGASLNDILSMRAMAGEVAPIETTVQIPSFDMRYANVARSTQAPLVYDVVGTLPKTAGKSGVYSGTSSQMGTIVDVTSSQRDMFFEKYTSLSTQRESGKPTKGGKSESFTTYAPVLSISLGGRVSERDDTRSIVTPISRTTPVVTTTTPTQQVIPPKPVTTTQPKTQPPFRPPTPGPGIPIPPIAFQLGGGGVASGGRSSRPYAFTERLRLGQGIGWINLVPAAKPTRRSAPATRAVKQPRVQQVRPAKSALGNILPQARRRKKR